MEDLEHSLTVLARQWNSGSYKTKAQRLYALCAMARLLQKDLGYLNFRNAANLKPRHIEGLLKHWQESGLGAATIKNNLAHLRTWARWIGKEGIIPASNDTLGAERRSYVPKETRALELSAEQLDLVVDARLRLVFRLERAFGLRREEALKLIPTLADKGNYLDLVGSWCKGGKPRTVPIRTDFQRQLVDEAKRLTGPGRPMGGHLGNYKSAAKAYERACEKAEIKAAHGLRHAYAQERYLEITGWPAPLAGGPVRQELTDDMRAVDQAARLVISSELGHAREQITVTYLGR